MWSCGSCDIREFWIDNFILLLTGLALASVSHFILKVRFLWRIGLIWLPAFRCARLALPDWFHLPLIVSSCVLPSICIFVPYFACVKGSWIIPLLITVQTSVCRPSEFSPQYKADLFSLLYIWKTAALAQNWTDEEAPFFHPVPKLERKAWAHP